ncbi:MAG: M23 family metallopeptidase [Candidatus Methylomirabilales bacterium]
MRGNVADGTGRRRWRAWPPLALGAVALLLAVLGVGLILRHGPHDGPPGASPESGGPLREVAPPSPNFLKILGKGRTLQDALEAHGVRQDLALNIIRAFRPHLDFRRLRPTDSLEFEHDQAGTLMRIVYRQSPVDVWEALRVEDEWRASRLDIPVERRRVLVAGALDGNLFESIEALGEQPQLVLDFAEIFAYDFDFASDSQPGDRFRMLVEKVYTGDRFVRYGPVQLAEYEEREGRVHTGIYFRDGEEAGYYTPAGESLRRAFLKSPLEFTRISSGYTRARRHPILGGVRPHLAVDYAAPHGTPVWAVADGVVEFAGYSGGNGNTVILRHRANFKTMYNHLAGFSRAVRKGAVVRQRSVIGYVGSTGLSTGPHLDYRVMKDGVFVNPLKQTFLPGRPVSPAAQAAFAARRDALLGEMRAAQRAASAPRSAGVHPRTP